MEKIAFKAEVGGEAVLALNSGLNELQFAKSGRASSVKEKGLILLGNGEATAWAMRGTFCPNELGSVAFYGDCFEGSSLLSIVEDAASLAQQEEGKKAEEWRRFVFAARALYKDDEKARCAFAKNGPASVLCGEGGRLLVLPPRVFADCASSLPEEARFALTECWTHPYLKGGGKERVSTKKAFAFTLGCLALKMLAGEHPLAFLLKEISALKEEKAEKPVVEEFGALAREKCFVPAKAAVWGINAEAAAALDALLIEENADGAIARFFTLCEELPAILSESASGDATFDAFNDNLLKEKEKLAKKYLAKRSARRHKGALVAAILCAAIAAAVGFSIAQDAKGRPTTAGLEPFEVVQGFYESVGSLDPEVPKAFALRGAAKRYADLTSTLYVTQKMTEAYSFERVWVTPSEFYAAAKEGAALPQEARVCGITRLEAREASREADTAVFNVSFFFWGPIADNEREQELEEAPAASPITVYACSDRVILSFNQKKARWAITAIESAEWTALPATRQDIADDAAQCAKGGESRYPFAP